jgi:hypothetical protein
MAEAGLDLGQVHTFYQQGGMVVPPAMEIEMFDPSCPAGPALDLVEPDRGMGFFLIGLLEEVLPARVE